MNCYRVTNPVTGATCTVSAYSMDHALHLASIGWYEEHGNRDMDDGYGGIWLTVEELDQ